MKNRTYRYTGPNSAATIVVIDARGAASEHEVMLWRDRDVELPEDGEYTKQLLAQGLITPVIAAIPTPAPVPARKPAAAPAAAIAE